MARSKIPLHGADVALHFLLLVVFLLPYIAEAIGWRGANQAQELFKAQLHIFAQRVSQVGTQHQAYLSSIANQIDNIVPCLSRRCEPVPVWKLLMALNQGWRHWLPRGVLLIYNACRAVLTIRVSQMRDEEENTETTPVASGIIGYGWL